MLLTGANGFVGSHILERLCRQAIPTAVLLRPTSNRRLIEPHLPQVEVHYGSLTDPVSLLPALQAVTHVIHCAGCTKARSPAEFSLANQHGTRRIVEAVNQCRGAVKRFIYISSLAASRPALPTAPAVEDDPPSPVSEYGRSKLAGELEVRQACQSEFVILRPAAVYGPGDSDFLMLFKTAKARLCPVFQRGRQAISLVFVKDLADAVLACLAHPAAAGRTYNVAAPESTTAGGLAGEIARQLQVKARFLPLPLAILWLACAGQEIVSRLTGVPHILSREKYKELRAPGWVCDPSRLRIETGFVARTSLDAGIAQTLDWYRCQGWLK